MTTNQTSNNGKKSQWDGRVLANQDGVLTKQQLPIRQKYIPMNGNIRTGGYGHIGVKTRMNGKHPVMIKNRNEKKEHIDLPPLDYPLENPKSIRYKNPNSNLRSVSYDSKKSVSYDSRQHESLSVETEKTEIKSDDDYDYDIYEKDFDDDVSIDSNNLHNNNDNHPSLSSETTPNKTPSSEDSPFLSKLSSLEIEVSESIQTIDKEELEMKRQIYEMSTMNLNNTNKVKRVQTPCSVKESSPFGDDLEVNFSIYKYICICIYECNVIT
jgi:hypothetical protein